MATLPLLLLMLLLLRLLRLFHPWLGSISPLYLLEARRKQQQNQLLLVLHLLQ